MRHARRALEMLSTETGGIAFFPKSIEQVDQIAAEVARDIRSQYTLGYHSTKPTTEPGFRRVQVTAEAKGMGKLTVRTRTGYFPSARVAKTSSRQQRNRPCRPVELDWIRHGSRKPFHYRPSAVAADITQLVGHTPMLQLARLAPAPAAAQCLPSLSF